MLYVQMDNAFSHSVVIFVGESKETFFCNSRYFHYMLLTHAGSRLTYNCTQQGGNYFPTSNIFIRCSFVYLLTAITVDNYYELDSIYIYIYITPNFPIPHKYLQNNIEACVRKVYV